MTFLCSGFSFSTEILKCFWLKDSFYLDRAQHVVVVSWPGLQLGWHLTCSKGNGGNKGFLCLKLEEGKLLSMFLHPGQGLPII